MAIVCGPARTADAARRRFSTYGFQIKSSGLSPRVVPNMVTSFDNDTEFSQGGDVTFTTKNGTTNFHGSLFEYLQNDAFDAKILNFNVKAPNLFNTFAKVGK
jgi:hypothetical protein